MYCVSDILTVTFDSGLDDEAGICISRVVDGKTVVLKMVLGEQAEILYYLLTNQTAKAKIKVESLKRPESEDKSCSNCKYWLLDKNDESRKCKYCFEMDEWVAKSEDKECRTCKHSFTTGKDRVYCKKSLADKDDCGEYEMAIKALEQEPFMNKPCVSHQVCHEDKVKVLDKIRAEIEDLRFGQPFRKFVVDECLEIIDKYISESEDKE